MTPVKFDTFPEKLDVDSLVQLSFGSSFNRFMGLRESFVL